MLPIFLFNEVELDQFLNEDPIIIISIVIIPVIIHGTITYSIINNIISFNSTIIHNLILYFIF